MAILGLSIFLVGVLVGVGGAYALYDNKLQEETRTTSSLLNLTQRQYQQLSEKGSSKTALQEPLAAAPVIQVATVTSRPAVLPASAAASHPPTSPVQVKPPPVKAPVALPAKPVPVVAPKPAQVAPKAPQVVQPQIAIVAPRPTISPSRASEAPSKPPAPPTATTTPGAITMEQAGIAGIDTASVRFKSGRQINVGGEFPTGEKLISVNPGEGRIVTDRRVILLAKPPMAQ